MAIEHERIHLETSSVLFRQLPIHQIDTSTLFKRCTNMITNIDSVPHNDMLPVPATLVNTGKSFDDIYYGWDNEYGSHSANVSSFTASKYLVSNAEFCQFVDDNGYSQQQYWGQEGWNFLNFRKLKHPLFWIIEDDPHTHQRNYYYRTMNEIISMPWDWPVDVNYIEAKAFTRWKAHKTGQNIRLPTEDEYIAMREFAWPSSTLSSSSSSSTTTLDSDKLDQFSWKVAPGNINLEHYSSSCPINEFEFEHGFYDIIGNVWQHTETPISAYKGFRFHPFYDDFSIPTFDSRHNIIKGGSFISTGNEATRSARYAFRRHFYQHAGFRYICSNQTFDDINNHTSHAMCETDPAVSQIIHCQYSDSLLCAPNFSVRLCDLIMKVYAEQICDCVSTNDYNRALDIGSGCGRMTFELANAGFAHVQALDLSTRFVRIASQLLSQTSIQCKYTNIIKHNAFHIFQNILCSYLYFFCYHMCVVL